MDGGSSKSPTFSLVVMTALGDLLGRSTPTQIRRGRQFERICQWFLRTTRSTRTSFAGCGCGMSGRAAGALTPVSTWSPRTTTGTCGRSRPRRTTLPTASPRRRGHVPLRVGPAAVLLPAADRDHDRIGRTAKRTIDEQEKQASFLLLAELEAAEVGLARLPVGSAPRNCRRRRPTAPSARSDQRGSEGIQASRPRAS